MNLIRSSALPLLLALAMSAPALAQGVQTGTLRGTVVDAQGLALPGVTVTISSPAMQGDRTAITGTDGGYRFLLLPAGSYDIRFTLDGFEPTPGTASVPLGGDAERNVQLPLAGVTTQVDVVAAIPPAASNSTNLRRETVEALATSRSIEGIAELSSGVTGNVPNAGQVSIHGGFGFDNAFLLNGVDVNDNIFGSPQALYIPDAIEETQVLTSGISAEYGRFSGGVVNTITRSGGNAFSGSLRVNLTNPSWTEETPFDTENDVSYESSLNDTYEMTLGGPIVRDRVWFFLAGRLASVDSSETLPVTGAAYSTTTDNTRGEVKLTVTPVTDHTLQGGYVTNTAELENGPSFPFTIDPRTLATQKAPNWYTFVNYRGIASTSLLVEGQFSERHYAFDGVGGTSRDIVDSPFITLTQELAHYNAPYFDATDPEERNNRQFTGTVTYFAEGAGRHELKAGVEWFRSQNTGGNSQSATNYVFDADFLTDVNGDPVLDAQGRLIPLFVPVDFGNPFAPFSLIENWMAVRGAELNVDTTSLFVQDRWTLTPRLTANLGFRFEKVRSEATGDIVGVDTDTIVPRLALSYDVTGDGRLVLSSSYGHYSGRYNEAEISVNSNVGNPSATLGAYVGPAGQGLDFAPGLDPDNYFTFQGFFPTANVFFEDGLSSPITREFTVSAATAPSDALHAQVTYVWRDTTDFIEDFIDLSNGTTEVEVDGEVLGEFTNVLYRNTGEPQRRYQAAVLEGDFRPRSNWSIHAAWTIQLQNEGNYVGEGTGQPAIPSIFGDYPEAFTEERHYPIGKLPNFQRHRARLWTIYGFDMGQGGDLSVSGLWRIESGTPYSLVATAVPLSFDQLVLLADYPDPPFEQALYFGERGSETFPAYSLVDVSLSYDVPVFRSLRPWVKFDVFNLFNNDELVGFDTTVEADPSSPLDGLGLPTGYIEGENFGEATSANSYPTSLGAAGGRSFRVSLGFRF